MKAEDVPKLKVAELKAELKARGEPISGLKAELAARLTAWFDANVRPDLSCLECHLEGGASHQPLGLSCVLT